VNAKNAAPRMPVRGQRQGYGISRTIAMKRPRCNRCDRRFLRRFDTQMLCSPCWRDVRAARLAEVQPDLPLAWPS
jgi:hypothetical protein